MSEIVFTAIVRHRSGGGAGHFFATGKAGRLQRELVAQRAVRLAELGIWPKPGDAVLIRVPALYRLEEAEIFSAPELERHSSKLSA